MENENQFQQLWDDSKKVMNSHYDLLRLEMLEKTAQLFNLLLVSLLGLLLLLIAIVFAAVAITQLLGEMLGSMGAAYLIMAGVFLLSFLLIYVFRHKLFVKASSRQITQILFPVTKEAPKREVVELQSKHNVELVQRDLEVIKANLMGVQVVGHFMKKAFSYIEERLFDADEDDELYADHKKPISEVDTVEEQED